RNFDIAKQFFRSPWRYSRLLYHTRATKYIISGVKFKNLTQLKYGLNGRILQIGAAVCNLLDFSPAQEYT
ncbi:MAG: hypothetical protein K2G26_03910, partial [Clostridia bacterium]|nr:hypothetical protein [Clostridia bacterium]